MRTRATASPSTSGSASVDAILREGLHRRGRHHVHLSPDVGTARAVGRRHGPPVVIEVDAAAMADGGHTFHVTPNGVWLTEAVPPAYLRRARD